MDDVVAGYGHVIVDECDHVSASSFARVLSEVKARFVLGLATKPRRRDGHDPIVEMQPAGEPRLDAELRADQLEMP